MLARSIALFLIAVLMLFGFLTGFFMSALAFRDPDICWLLALGRWISEHGHLPYQDPFSSNLSSYAFISPQLPLIQYQWLSELVFFFFWQLGKQPALLIFLSLLASVTFIAIPAWLLLNRQSSFMAVVLIVLGFACSAIRFVARPEMFSSFWLVLLILVLYRYRELATKQQLAACLAIFVISSLWSNSHMLFPLSVIITGLLCCAWFGQAYLENRENLRQPVVFMGLPFIAALSGTLLNPWGLGLWQYECRLLISPVSFANIDHHAPIWTNLPGIAALSLFIIAALWLGLVMRNVGILASLPGLLLYGCSLYLGTKYAKLIPQCYLLICAALVSLPPGAAEIGRIGKIPYLMNISSTLNTIWERQKTVVMISIAGLACAGALALMRMSGIPQMPGSTACFTPPFQAIEYLERCRPAGRLLNEGLFGSTMTWYMRNCPDLFIDSRFSMFEPDLVRDYEHMMLCEGDWQKLLSKYGIAWVFLPVHVPLANALLGDCGWQVDYKDSLALVLSKKSLPGGKANLSGPAQGIFLGQQGRPASNFAAGPDRKVLRK